MAPNRTSRAMQQSSLARYWTTTHAPDYVGLSVLLTIWILVASLAKPFHRMFFINDLAISFPHAEVERVPLTILFVYALFVPLGILIAYNTIRRSSRLKHEVTYLSFAIAIVLSAVITDIIKNAVGRPRPDLLARCLPSPDTLPDVLVTIDACTRADGHVLQDGWRSFPSGHSSFGFAGLGFLSLFLAGQLHVFRYASGGRDLGRTILCLAPLVGAALIAISRCEDYRHDVYDVCVGTVIGATVAYWSYRRHWPSLASGGSDEPYPRPGQEAALPLGATSGSANAHGGGWQRVRDQEEAIGGDLGDRDEVRYELR